ncbi:hypothetical protein ALC62_02641 [Cyphomyrmex costatus]|uniref:Uncharacterized protein n=1 Tax=Cyphomyrmex costatus TaxID=456900 RepID=A0A151IMZ4_9HYME|nr:hypothetical protein ALC62_02641 [Cyphomyrmex costatus]
MSALYYSHREHREIRCTECYGALTDSGKESYAGVLLHYIQLGRPDQFEICGTCSAALAVARALTTCRGCPRTLEGFLIYLDAEEDRPWEDSDPTILFINRVLF